MKTKLDLSVIKPDLLAAVMEIARLVRAARGRAYLVGGSVRDLLLGGTAVKDVDLEVFGVPPEVLPQLIGTRFAYDACGISFGVLKIQHLDIDVSLPRRESKRGIGHKGFLIDADPTLSVAEAASRRDFTINAMYYDPLEEAFEDPYGGVADLQARMLRHVSAKFVEDPLRVLRGMQFVARFGLSPAPETIAICQTVGIEDLPPERLFEEWSKFLLKGTVPSRGLEFLRAAGWVRYFPELERLIGCEQDPTWHPEGDVWNHTLACLDVFARNRTGNAEEDLIVGLAVLCHDLGKPATSRVINGRIRSLGHDTAGIEPTLSFLRRLTNEERILREVPPLVAHHMQPFALWRSQAGDSAIRRLARDVVRIDRLLRVAQADSEGALGSSSPHTELDWLGAAAERLRIADAAPKPLVLGRHLIALGHTPSAQFGPWLAACFEAQLDGAFTTVEDGIRYFQSHVEPTRQPAR